jgi:hypothetical protein
MDHLHKVSTAALVLAVLAISSSPFFLAPGYTAATAALSATSVLAVLGSLIGSRQVDMLLTAAIGLLWLSAGLLSLLRLLDATLTAPGLVLTLLVAAKLSSYPVLTPPASKSNLD